MPKKFYDIRHNSWSYKEILEVFAPIFEKWTIFIMLTILSVALKLSSLQYSAIRFSRKNHNNELLWTKQQKYNYIF